MRIKQQTDEDGEEKKKYGQKEIENEGSEKAVKEEEEERMNWNWN